jgi:hypothetical protein
LKLIFLTYINRSGSTYLSQMLSSSEEILVCPEAEILVENFLEDPGKNFIRTKTSLKKVIHKLNTDWKFRHWNISREELESIFTSSDNFNIFRSILNLYRKKTKPDASIILFKAERIIYLWNRLSSTKHGDDLLHLVVLVRDPRGVYASQKNTRWPGSDRPFSDNPVYAGILWNRYIKEIYRLKKVHSNVTLIRFEEYLRNPELSLKSLSERVQLKINSLAPENGDYYSRIPEDQKQIHENIRSRPIMEKENEWKGNLNNMEIDLIQNLTERYMYKLGYTAETRRNNFLKIRSIIILESISYYFRYYTEKIIFRINKIMNGRDSI